MGTSTHTLQNGRQELLSGEGPGAGRIRRTGAGRKSVLPQHPEWTQAVVQIIEPHTAGLPQDENVVWISLSVTQIMSELSGNYSGAPDLSINRGWREAFATRL